MMHALIHWLLVPSVGDIAPIIGITAFLFIGITALLVKEGR